jgi:hypothetical protein
MMQTDELRAELAELAREVDPFPEDLAAIRRRVARRRVAGISVAAVLIVGLIAGAIATTRSSGDHVNVAGHPKAVAAAQLERVDALVALPARATAVDVTGVKEILDSTHIVERYARLPQDAFFFMEPRGDQMRPVPNLQELAREFGHSVIFGVQLDRSGPDGMHQLTAAVGSSATVKHFFALKGGAAGYEVEIFMAVKACAAQIAAVRVAIERDPEVESFRFFSKEDALNEFKKLFQDEPTLIENTTAESLPTSFRLRLRGGVLPWAVARRYEQLAGVRSVNAPANPFGSDASFTPPNEDQSACR